MKRLSVRAVAPCWIGGKDRKVGELFLLDPELLEHPDKLPSCLQRVRTEALADDGELVEVSQP